MESLKKSQMNMKLGKTKTPPETETSAADGVPEVAAAETDDSHDTVAANGNVSTAIVQRAPIATEEKCEVTFIDDDGGSPAEKEECNCGSSAATSKLPLNTC